MNVFPIFRLTIALVAGILFANTYWTRIAYWPISILLFLLLVLGSLLKSHSYAGRWIYGMGVSLFMFGTGWILTVHAWEKVQVDWPQESQFYQGIVLETPREKAKTYQCHVKVADKKVLVYLPKDSLSASIEVGDGLLFYTRIESPTNKDGFHEFDYAGFLYRQGVSGTAYVSSDDWSRKEKEGMGDWKLKALSFREKIIGKYREWGIGNSQLPVLSA